MVWRLVNSPIRRRANTTDSCHNVMKHLLHNREKNPELDVRQKRFDPTKLDQRQQLEVNYGKNEWQRTSKL